MALAAAFAQPALAGGTGGVAASGTPATTTTPKRVVPAVHLFPVTSRSRSVAYNGPVYQRLASGEVVPFVAATALAAPATVASSTGGATPTETASTAPVSLMSTVGPAAKPELLVPGTSARYVNGLAAAPMGAPAAVQKMIWAANEVIGLPYVWGGGHQAWKSSGYDCSGTVSYALHGAALLTVPEDSSEMEGYGSHGIGRWVSVFANPEHAYMTIAGLRLDTSAADDPSNQQGPRWRPLRPANEGFTVRHPRGL